MATIFGTNFIFAPLSYKSRYYPEATPEYLMNSPNNEWMLFPDIQVDMQSSKKLIESREQLITNNIKILSLNKALGKPQNAYLLSVDGNQRLIGSNIKK